MCGGSPDQKRRPPDKEVEYLDALVRGVYAKRDLPQGYVLNHDTMHEDLYLAIPLQKGQISCRELMSGETLQRPVLQDQPITIDAIDSAYAYTAALKELIMRRGL
jgi:N-acetylneuraminate synthase